MVNHWIAFAVWTIMAAVEGVPITIATRKNLTIMRVIYKVECFRKIFMLPVNFGPFFQSLLAHRLIFIRGNHRRCSIKKVSLEISQNSQENTCARESFLMACNFIKKDSLGQLFSCGFCQISKNTFFIEHLRTTASVSCLQKRNDFSNLKLSTKILT